MEIKWTKRYIQNGLLYLFSIHSFRTLLSVRCRSMWHMCLAVVEWRLQRETLWSRPTMIRIEPAAGCNLRCPLCRTPFEKVKKGQKTLLSFGDFKTIFAKLKRSVLRLTFYMEGEPLLNKELFDMVHYAKRLSSVYTSLSTNLTLARTETIEKMIASRLDFLSVSLDGFYQHSYQRYRVGGKVDDVLHAIKKINRQKKTSNQKLPIVEVNMIRFKYITRLEENELRHFCKQNGVDRFVTRPEQYGLWGSYQRSSQQRPSCKCYWPYLSMSIDVSGNVFTCPIAYEQKISAGNLLQQSLTEIWNGPFYRAVRRYLATDNDERRDLPHLPCYDCRWFGKVEASNPVLEARQRLKERRLPVLTDNPERQRNVAIKR